MSAKPFDSNNVAVIPDGRVVSGYVWQGRCLKWQKRNNWRKDFMHNKPCDSSEMRKGFWKRFVYTKYQLRSEVAQHVMSVHPTSAATEQNWWLWGRVYACSALLHEMHWAWTQEK
jgi:hypothetical protein